jgi:hypothetical protein
MVNGSTQPKSRLPKNGIPARSMPCVRLSPEQCRVLSLYATQADMSEGLSLVLMRHSQKNHSAMKFNKADTIYN